MEHPHPCIPTLTTLGAMFTRDVKVILLNDHHVLEVVVVPKRKDQLAEGLSMVLHLHVPAQGEVKRHKLKRLIQY